LQRVELIMGIKTRPVLSFNKFAGLLGGLICIIALNALLIISKPPGRKTAGSFASLSSPFNFFTNSISGSTEATVAEEQKPATITNSSRQANAQPVTAAWHGSNLLPLPSSNPGIINVKYEPVEAMQLKKYEEAQVKAAMDASKKVLENEEWKALEKNVADVFTQKEKEELKETYQKEMDKVDWNKWENKLRLAYDKVDWSRVNEQLSKAVNNIRIDSLQKVYTDVICKLDLTQQELTQNNLPGIPDSDITLKTIDERRQLVQKTLNKLKAVRNKKIVHL